MNISQSANFSFPFEQLRTSLPKYAYNVPRDKFDEKLLENAKKAGLNLRPTKVLVFGNAAVGTNLMLNNQAIALDLLLRVSIWQDERSRVWVSFHSIDRLANEYAIKDAATVKVLSRFMENLIARSVNVYEY